MSTPITISLFYKGKQKDYNAIFTNDQLNCELAVFINDVVVNFEGKVNETFQVKNKNNHPDLSQADASILETINQQLNQIFF